MVIERIFQTELTIQDRCEEKSVYKFPGKACVVHESNPLQNIRMSSGSVHEDIMLKEEAVDDPDKGYEDNDMKLSSALKDVTVSNRIQGEKRKIKEKTYPCEKCNLISQSSANFKKHMMTHSGEKPYKCIICQKAFRQRHHLTDHRRTHTGERPFECDECGATFVQKSSLNLHKKKHSGIKPYSCNICNHSTYEKMHMIMHMRTHTGEKPYQCEKCGHMFSNATRLKFHRMIHTGERRFKCDECGVNFREKVTLQKHKGVHINVGPFECEECGQEFSRLAGLSLHRKVHTKKHDYLYVFNKTAHEALKSTPPAEVAASKNRNTQSSEIVSNSAGTKNTPNAVHKTQNNIVSYEEQLHNRRITSSIPGTAKSDSNMYIPSTDDSNETGRSEVILGPVEKCSQNRVKESLASSLCDNIQNLGSVVHPDHVRAALVSGTVLETQDEHGKGFFIVLPPSLRNKDITLISDSTNSSDSMISVPLQVANHAMDVPGNETIVENSPETFSKKDDVHKEAYESVVQEIHEVDVCNYPVEVPEVEMNSSPKEMQEQHDDDDDNIHHYQEESHLCPEDVRGELADDEHRYSQVVREEIHADGTSLLLWNDGLEHLTEVTYVIEEGNEDPIMIHPQETKTHGIKMLGEVELTKPKKRKSKGNELSDDDHINPRRQKRPKSGCERPVSVRVKVKDKKLKEKRVKPRKVYDCQQCGKVCKTSSNYISHMRTHSGERPYFCDFCRMGFKQIAHLRSHIRIHTGERPYVCTICNAAFTQSSRLNSHRKTKHAEGRNVVTKKDKPVIEHKVRNFYCKVCKKTFINECFKIDHMRTHISLEPYECKICGIRYKSKTSMIKHSLKHSDHKCICEICGSGFLDLSSLQNHRITQHEMSLTESGMSDVCINVKIGEEKDFVVINPSIKDIQKDIIDGDKVNEEFINVTEANDCQVKQEVIHVTDADGYVKSEVMPVADFDDTLIKNEKMEVMETEGYCVEVMESPVSDTVSDIKVKNEIEQSTEFKDTDRESDACQGPRPEFQLLDTSEPIKDEFSEKNYATYVNSIGRKIWVCKVCDKPFLQSSNLHSHMRMHTGERPYKCNICPRAFRQITHLKDHMSRHTGMKPYKCGECGSCFSQRSAVTRHIKNLHNEKAHVIKNNEYVMSGGRNLPILDFDNQPSEFKQPLQFEKIVSRRPRKEKLKEDVNQNSSAKMKTCDICEKPYTATYLKSHQRCHTGERPYKCSFCEEAFRQKAHLNSHELRHTRKKSFVCKKCGVSFIQSYMLKSHIKKCMEDKEGINTCSIKKHMCICGTSFKLSSQLVRHQKSCMDIEDSDDKSIDMTELDTHLDEKSEDECQFRRKKNPGNEKGVSERNRTPETAEVSPASIVKIFTCKVCSVTLKDFGEYKTHLLHHGGDTQQVCEDCGIPFRRASALKFHQRVKHGRIDDRYKDYNFVGQEDVKEEYFDSCSDDDDDDGQVQPNQCVESDSYSDSTARRIEESVEKSSRGPTKNVKTIKKHRIMKPKSNRHSYKGNPVKRSITHTQEYAGRVGNKSVRGSTRLKNKRNKRSSILPDRIKSSKASNTVVDKQVKKLHKTPDGDYDTLYSCEACGKVFTRSSKLKHHVAMWCKGMQDHSVDVSKNLELKQQPSQTVKRVKRKCSKLSRKGSKELSPVLDSSTETNKNFRERCNSESDILCQPESHIVKDNIDLKDDESKMEHEVLSTLDSFKPDQQESKQRTVKEKNFSISQYCKDCDIHYKRTGSCTVHLGTHVAKQPFKCNQCCLTFSRKAYLSNHSKKHRNEKPYQCLACNKAFTQSSRLKDHMRIHGKNIRTFEI